MKSYHTTPSKNQVFLKDESKKDSHWDRKKTISRSVADVFGLNGDNAQKKKAERVHCCSNYLLFGIHKHRKLGTNVFKLKDARFCKVRLCPICQHRRSLVWKARMHKAYPELRLKYPKIRFIHVTLTVKNCGVNELKETLKMMSVSFNRLTKRMTKNKTIVGFMRSVEITREMEFCPTCQGSYSKKSSCKDRKNHIYTQNCHPHMHVIFAVPDSYFHPGNYLSKEKWSDEWKKSLKCDYKPVVWISLVKAKKKKDGEEFDKNTDEQELALSSAVKEVAKYSVKVDEELLESVLKDEEGKKWFLELDRQLAGTRAIGLGGCFKEFLKESDPEDDEMLKGEDEQELIEAAHEFRQYFYSNKNLAYTLKGILKQDEDGIIQGFREKVDSS